MSCGSALGFPLKVQHVDGTMASSVGAPWLVVAWLPGLQPADSEWGEARLPAIRAAAPEEANGGPRALITPLHANMTVYFILDFLIWGPTGKRAVAESRSFIF